MSPTTFIQPAPPRAHFAARPKSTVFLSQSAVGASPQSSELRNRVGEVERHLALPAYRRQDTLRERFRALAHRWRSETRWFSSTTEIAMNPAYQAIIGMGPAALPMILEDLRQNSGHWFWALKAISDEDPVVPRDRGSVKEMKRAWLRWGETKCLLRP
jgi:hypothetical protein